MVQACAKALELLTLESVANRRKRYCLVREEIIRATERYAVPLLSARVRSPVCLALTAKGVIDTEEDFNEFYRHLVRYNLYIYAKFHAQTRSFRIGCIGAIKPAWILVLAKAFREFFEDHKHRLVEAALDNPELESGAA